MSNESTKRLPIGQLLVRLLHHFRSDIYEYGQAVEAYSKIRAPHLHIWGSLGTKGVRLTHLAQKTNLSLATCSELVTELAEMGFIEKRPDPQDGRAKLIYPTRDGKRLLADANRWVDQLERRWAELVPPGDFEQATETLNTVLDQLDNKG